MSGYQLAFHKAARREWDKLGHDLQRQFAEKLAERLVSRRVVADKLSGMKDCYKIKLRSAGYRLVYRVDDGVLEVLVLSVGKRDKAAVYEAAKSR